jgi:hypothetical protein
VIVVNIRESVDKLLESGSLNDCWDKLLPEGINDVQRLYNQKDEIWNILVLACSRSRRRISTLGWG